MASQPNQLKESFSISTDVEPTVEQILAAIEAHSSRSLDIARASLEAAAVQAALLEEQQKQRLIAQRREAIEREQFDQVWQLIQEIRLMLATHQEVLNEIRRHYSEIEQLQQQTIEFMKVAIASGLKMSKSQARQIKQANLRSLLVQGFSLDELTGFCFDNPKFRPVYEQLSHATGKSEAAQKIIEYAEQRKLTGELLKWAKTTNPAIFTEGG